MSRFTEARVPHSPEAECALLGSILLDNSCWTVVNEIITKDDLFADPHRLIFQAMANLANACRPVDTVTVFEELNKSEMGKKAGGVVYIASLTDGVPVGDHAFVANYAQIIKEKSQLRRIINTANNLMSKAVAAVEDPPGLIEFGIKELIRISDIAQQTGLVSIREIAKSAEMQRLMEHGSRDGLPTGYADLDALTMGLHAKELIILAARTGVGKSAFAGNIAVNVASRGRKVAFFSLEMSKETLLVRMICSDGRIDYHKVRSGFCTMNDMHKVTKAVVRIVELPIWIDETAGISIVQLRSRASRLKQEQGLDLLIVDYLQLLAPGSLLDGKQRFEKRYIEVDAVTKGLKAIAKDLQIPVLALAQLSRETDKGSKPREPRLSDLRESGSIEQDADLVLFLHPKASEEEECCDGQPISVILGKQRNGPQGRLELLFLPQFTRFENRPNMLDRAPSF